MDDASRDPELPRAQPPDETLAPRTGSPSPAAGGVGALAATLRYAHAQTGLVRGTRVLVRTNQDPGFDCPGCAWPEPRDRDAAWRWYRRARPSRLRRAALRHQPGDGAGGGAAERRAPKP